MTHHYVQAKYFGVNEVSAVLGIIFFYFKGVVEQNIFVLYSCVCLAQDQQQFKGSQKCFF